jgi:hypothetical protein
LSLVMTSQAAAATGSILFADYGSGAKGAAPDPSKWVSLPDGWRGLGLIQSAVRKSNAYYDGKGHLVLRAKREAKPWPTPFSGSRIATFVSDHGYPSPSVRAAWSPPYEVKSRARNIGRLGGGDFQAGKSGEWNVTVNQTVNTEIDWNEYRSTFPTEYIPHQHHYPWATGAEDGRWSGDNLVVADQSKTWHVYTADVYPDHVDYFIDGHPSGTTPYGVPATDRQGVELTAFIPLPGTWAAGRCTCQPAADDPGPWVMLVDYVVVHSITSPGA